MGHKKLIETAFAFADHVLIGLSTDEFAKKRKKKARPYAARKKALEEFLASRGWNAEIVPLDDYAGPAATSKELDAIIVSEETRERAERINQQRMARKLHPLVILVIPMQRDGNGDKVSSSLLNKS
jgi:pantetheine-phosphate adenylyltransferase